MIPNKPLRADLVNIVKSRNLRFGWPLDRSDWDILPRDLLFSKDWKSVIIGHHEAKLVPDRPGIYMLCASPPGMNPQGGPFSLLYETIYVGESDNLQRRLRQHLNTPSPKVRAARMCYALSLRFWYHLVEMDRIKLVESLLIQCLGPPANDKPGVGAWSAITGEPRPAGKSNTEE